MKPKSHVFNGSITAPKVALVTNGSWWASGLSREQFAAQVKAEAERMRNSAGEQMVSSLQGGIAKERSQ